MAEDGYTKVGHFKEVASFQQYLQTLGVQLPIDAKVLSAAEGSPLAQPIEIGGRVVGNRWCIHPMEGWDANADGSLPFLLPWAVYGDEVLLEWDYAHEYPNPVTPSGWPRSSTCTG